MTLLRLRDPFWLHGPQALILTDLIRSSEFLPETTRPRHRLPSPPLHASGCRLPIGFSVEVRALFPSVSPSLDRARPPLERCFPFYLPPREGARGCYLADLRMVLSSRLCSCSCVCSRPQVNNAVQNIFGKPKKPSRNISVYEVRPFILVWLIRLASLKNRNSLIPNKPYKPSAHRCKCSCQKNVAVANRWFHSFVPFPQFSGRVLCSCSLAYTSYEIYLRELEFPTLAPRWKYTSYILFVLLKFTMPCWS